MDVASARWLSELGMEEYNIFHQCEMNSLNQLGFTSDHDILGDQNYNQQSLSSESYSSYSTITTKNNPSNTTSSGSDQSIKNSDQAAMAAAASFEYRPPKLVKIATGGGGGGSVNHVLARPSSSCSSQLLSFENSKPHFITNSSLKPKKEELSQIDMNYFSSAHDHGVITKDSLKGTNNNNNKRTYNSMTRSPSNAQDHILAERKRREKLSQRFIALSAIVPGLKKMDKASVLGEAIKYVKQLQERVSNLEEQTKKRTVESVVLVKKSQVNIPCDHDDTSSCDENFDHGRSDHHDQSSLPEIEAKVSDKDVLIRIHCEKHKGVVVQVLSEIEKLNLSVLNTSVLPFGNSTLDVTIIAQMEVDFSMTVKDLAKNLRLALLKFM